MKPTTPPKLHIVGVPVCFPHTPYRAQVALMHAVVNAVKNRTHALVESPTGTGKSLALLCSSLSIQSHLRLHPTDPEPSPIERHSPPPPEPPQLPRSDSPASPAVKPGVKPPPQEVSKSEFVYSNPADSDEDDFQPQRNFRDVSWQRPVSKDRKRPAEEMPENQFMLQRTEQPLDSSEHPPSSPTSDEPPKPSGKRVPRVFYATRTHSQVTQVVSELRKTAYRPALSILASRREYCINDAVVALPARDDACKRLVADHACAPYYDAANLASHPQLDGSAWDIEELTNLGARLSACPYYASHELYQTAELILCPYSFLVDPKVREARGINLAGDVIILDEAHNIENYAREAASFETDVADLRRLSDDVENVVLTSTLAEGAADLVVAYRRLKMLLETFLSLVDHVINSEDFEQHDRSENAVFQRRNLLHLLERGDVNNEEVKYWRAAYDFIINYGDGNDSKRFKKMGTERTTIEVSPVKKPPSQAPASADPDNTPDKERKGNGSGPGYGYGPTMNGSGLAIEEPSNEPSSNSRGVRRGRFGKKMARKGGRRGRSKDGPQEKPWLSKCMSKSLALLTTLAFLFENPDDFILVVDRRTVDFVTVVTLSIHCLNAAVCFRDISSKARSVIVTSGTLTPMSSFAGELGTKFSVSKSLPHVIDVRRQLYIGVVGEGPRGERLEGTFQGAARFDFQDGLANGLIDYCKVIPGGVLVFFPSYRMMDQMRSRWKSCGAWSRLEEVKPMILVEPTQRGEAFDTIVSQYQVASKSNGGAVMFAVCRGKLSEGIDFRDDTSRAVVLIGIPFPYKKDIVVAQKCKWNDRARLEGKRKELQSGVEWYEMQAFRALNQALGRAVRHRYDYGAILLMDLRFRNERVLVQLPKWTREAVRRTDATHETIVRELDSFYKNIHEQLASIAAERREQG